MELQGLSKENIFIITQKDFQFFHYLVKEYVEVKSPKELNLSGKSRSQVLEVAKMNLKEWSYEKTPLEVLEPIRMEIYNNLCTEAFTRFYLSELGYGIISKNAKNSAILSQNPLYAVMYKIKENVHFNDTKQKKYQTIAHDLSASDRFLDTYFGDEKELKDLSVKIFLMESGRHSNINMKKMGNEYFESSDLIHVRGDNENQYYACLMIGKHLFGWDETHICIRK